MTESLTSPKVYTFMAFIAVLVIWLTLALNLNNHEDWANLSFYAVSSFELSKLPAGTNEVVFMGDSITHWWNFTQYFPNKPYVNRGIGAQTTSQMLVRFRPDLINLKPKLAVILGGINDIKQKYNVEDIKGSLVSMTELAHFNGIKVILASILPVCGAKIEERSPAEIEDINSFLEEYCKENGIIYLDYHSAMKDEVGLLIQEFSDDCIHPNAAGHAVMAPLAQNAIDQALSS